MNGLQFFIKLNCDNDAFTEDPGLEIGRILRNLADQVEGYATFDKQIAEIPVHDANGNLCGAMGYQVLP